MELLIATHNQSKYKRYKRLFEPIKNLQVFSLNDLNITEKAEEGFKTNIENAIHKAKYYSNLSNKITLAVDEALMTNFLPDNEQPGVYARRFADNKNELSDEELIEVWKKIFNKYPQDGKRFIWSFAIACCDPQSNNSFSRVLEEISFAANYPSSIKSNGYPLSTLLSFKEGGKPYIEMSDREKWEKDKLLFSDLVKDFNAWLEDLNCPGCL